MRVATEEFAAELSRRDRTQLSRVNILQGGRIVAAGLRVNGGTVMQTRGRSPRGVVNLSLAEPMLIPTPTSGVLSPLGYEVQVYNGLEIRGITPSVAYSGLVTDDMWVPLVSGDGKYILRPGGGAMFVAGRPATEELMSIGIFQLEVSRTGLTTLLTQITGSDRSQWLVDDELEADLAWPDAEGGSLEAHVQRLIRTCVQLSDPEVCALRFSGESHSPPVIVFPQGTKKWDIIERVVQGTGYEAYFDGSGDFVWQPIPDINSEPRFTLRSGVGGTLTDGYVELARSRMINKVIAVGGSSAETAVYRAEAVDDDPLSPTRYGGPAGKRQRTIRSSTYLSQAQAQAAADGELKNNLGVPWSYDLSAVPDPRLEVGDVGRINIERVGISMERTLLDSIIYDLSPEAAMSVQARSRPEGNS